MLWFNAPCMLHPLPNALVPPHSCSSFYFAPATLFFFHFLEHVNSVFAQQVIPHCFLCWEHSCSWSLYIFFSFRYSDFTYLSRLPLTAISKSRQSFSVTLYSFNTLQNTYCYHTFLFVNQFLITLLQTHQNANFTRA